MDAAVIGGRREGLNFQMNRKAPAVSSQASENTILNGFRTEEGRGVCWTGHSKNLPEGTKYYSRLVLLRCEAPRAAPTGSAAPDFRGGSELRGWHQVRSPAWGCRTGTQQGRDDVSVELLREKDNCCVPTAGSAAEREEPTDKSISKYTTGK